MKPLVATLKSGAPSQLGEWGIRPPYRKRSGVGGWALHGALLAHEKALEGFPSSQERKMSCLAQKGLEGPCWPPTRSPSGHSAEARTHGASPGLGWAGGHRGPGLRDRMVGKQG